MDNAMHMKCNSIIFGKFLSLVLIAMLFSFNSHAVDHKYKKLLDLSGEWKFSIGDKEEWSTVEYNDSQWETIRVPNNWENQGFNGFDGYAWYRTNFKLDEVNVKMSIYLSLGYIDDVDEVFINGVLIGKTGSFPPDYRTAYNAKRMYRIPIELLNSEGSNTIAVRIFDEGGEGGIIHGDIAIVMDITAIPVDLDLQGNWKFKMGNCNIEKITELEYNKWADIMVPDMWENQGYKNRDGYACYVIEFELNNQFVDENMVLILGKIDDLDQTYINGKLVGQTISYFANRKLFEYDEFHKQMRGYYLPEAVLIDKGTNVLIVKVLDNGGSGGIYEGSVGLITQTNYINYWRARRNKYTN